MKSTIFLKIVLMIILMSLSAFKINAQTGNLTGILIDKDGLYVPGASILILDIQKGIISDFDGKFKILKIPVGMHKLKITYLGYRDIIKDIEIKERETLKVNYSLDDANYQLNEIQISTVLRGQVKALNTQKNNINITNVVSTDQIGKFPDANIGDAVRRIAGITMQVDQGEARNIIVRGLSPQLNSVTLNGSRIPSTEGDNRNIQMDLIPSDMIQTIQVNKAVTPDMDADAIGGSVNLVTRTAPQGFRLSATGGSGTNTITGKRIINSFVLVGNRTENQKFGWMIGATINDNDFGSDNIEFEWDDSETDFVKEHDIRTYLVQRVRRSFSVNFDYKINNNNELYLKTLYNWRDDRENRYRLRYTDIEFNDAGVLTAQIRRQTKGGIGNDRNKDRRLEDQRMQNYTFGGNHLLGKLQIDWLTSFASASEEKLNQRNISFRVKDVPVNTKLSDTKFPVITPTNELVLSDYELKEITEENRFAEEKDYNAFLNLKLPITKGSIKFGARLRIKEKSRDNNFFEFEPSSRIFEDFSRLPLTDQTDSNYLAGSQYIAGQYVDPRYLGNLDLSDVTLFESTDVVDEYLEGNYEAEESVYGGYVMTTYNINGQFTILGGVRLESTEISATGNIVNFDADSAFDSATTTTENNTYTNFLPSIHLKYNVNKNSSLRFAWTNTIARPNYIDIVPFRNITREEDEIKLGNPDLNPTTSMNFDLLGETYFKNIGILSGGVFYKKVDDFIYTSVSKTTDDSLGIGTTGFDAFTPLNGDNSSIFGTEIAIQRQLDFLPGFLKNVSIYANYTFIDSNAKGVRNEDGDVRDDIDLPNTAPNMFNASLAYADKKLSFRLSANYSDAYIDEIGGNALEDRYYDEQFFLDFNAGFAINKNLRVYANVNNITGQPLRYYQGRKNRTMQSEYYGQRIQIGLKYDMFKK